MQKKKCDQSKAIIFLFAFNLSLSKNLFFPLQTAEHLADVCAPRHWLSYWLQASYSTFAYIDAQFWLCFRLKLDPIFCKEYFNENRGDLFLGEENYIILFVSRENYFRDLLNIKTQN